MTTKAMTNHHSNQKRNRKKGHTITGAVIAIIGFFWLAKKVGWIPVAAGGSQIFWPILTIVLGLSIVFAVHRGKLHQNNE